MGVSSGVGVGVYVHSVWGELGGCMCADTHCEVSGQPRVLSLRCLPETGSHWPITLPSRLVSWGLNLQISACYHLPSSQG